MALSYEFDGQVLRFTSEGDFDFDEGLKVLHGGLDRAREVSREQGRRIPTLIDIRHSTEQRSSDELRQVAEAIGEAQDVLDSRLAIVVLAPHLYGLSRMFAVFADWAGVEVRIFSDPDKATQWLLA